MVIPELRAVIVTVCATTTEYRLDDGTLDGLIDEVVVPALR